MKNMKRFFDYYKAFPRKQQHHKRYNKHIFLSKKKIWRHHHRAIFYSSSISFKPTPNNSSSGKSLRRKKQNLIRNKRKITHLAAKESESSPPFPAPGIPRTRASKNHHRAIQRVQHKLAPHSRDLALFHVVISLPYRHRPARDEL